MYKFIIKLDNGNIVGYNAVNMSNGVLHAPNDVTLYVLESVVTFMETLPTGITLSEITVFNTGEIPEEEEVTP